MKCYNSITKVSGILVSRFDHLAPVGGEVTWAWTRVLGF